MVHSLAQSLSLDFTRIQFTPDLMPSDITGTEVLYEDRQTGARELRFVHGPIFANLILADEINRTPPKTQAALLEAMQERQVTAGGRRHALPEPFFVLATQNPIEQEGTYPLPEAQLDRFLFKIFITYPKPEEERQIYRLTTGVEEHEITPMLTGARIAALQRVVRRVPVSDHCIDYAMDLVRRDPRARARRAGLHQRVGRLGRRPACRAIADPRRQGQGRPGRPAQRLDRRYPGRRPAGAAPSHRHQLQRPGRRRVERLDHQETARPTSRCERGPPMPPSRKYSDPDVIAKIADLNLRRAGSSRGRSAASTAARFTASISSSPSTATITPAMTSAGSTGASTPAPIVITSSNTRKRATSGSRSLSMPAHR